MTKTVRIENACNSDYKVVVEVWEGKYGDAGSKLFEKKFLPYPTTLGELMIHSHRYLVVREYDAELDKELK